MKKIFILIIASITLMACDNSDPTDRVTAQKLSSISLSEAPYAFAFSEGLAEDFEVDVAEATKLPDGVLAIRAYTKEHFFGDSLILQLYTKGLINLPLESDDILARYYDNSLSGFLRFNSDGVKNKDLSKKIREDEKAIDKKFKSLVISYSKEIATTASFERISKSLLPGYTLLEISIPNPDVTDIYLYTGHSPETDDKEIYNMIGALKVADNLTDYGYLKISLPKAIQKFYMSNCSELCQ